MNDIILTFHIAILILTVFCILWADIYASMWLHGKKQVLSQTITRRLHTAVSIGLTGMIATGIILFLPMGEYLIGQSNAFFVKIFFVLALVVNSFVIERYMQIATIKSFHETSKNEKIILFVSGAVSTSSWIGAIVAATQLT